MANQIRVPYSRTFVAQGFDPYSQTIVEHCRQCPIRRIRSTRVFQSCRRLSPRGYVVGGTMGKIGSVVPRTVRSRPHLAMEGNPCGLYRRNWRHQRQRHPLRWALTVQQNIAGPSSFAGIARSPTPPRWVPFELLYPVSWAIQLLQKSNNRNLEIDVNARAIDVNAII